MNLGDEYHVRRHLQGQVEHDKRLNTILVNIVVREISMNAGTFDMHKVS